MKMAKIICKKCGQTQTSRQPWGNIGQHRATSRQHQGNFRAKSGQELWQLQGKHYYCVLLFYQAVIGETSNCSESLRFVIYCAAYGSKSLAQRASNPQKISW